MRRDVPCFLCQQMNKKALLFQAACWPGKKSTRPQSCMDTRCVARSRAERKEKKSCLWCSRPGRQPSKSGEQKYKRNSPHEVELREALCRLPLARLFRAAAKRHAKTRGVAKQRNRVEVLSLEPRDRRPAA